MQEYGYRAVYRIGSFGVAILFVIHLISFLILRFCTDKGGLFSCVKSKEEEENKNIDDNID